MKTMVFDGIVREMSEVSTRRASSASSGERPP
jgi:hypothetical protein